LSGRFPALRSSDRQRHSEDGLARGGSRDPRRMRTGPPRRLRSTPRVAKSKTARAVAQALKARRARMCHTNFIHRGDCWSDRQRNVIRGALRMDSSAQRVGFEPTCRNAPTIRFHQVGRAHQIVVRLGRSRNFVSAVISGTSSTVLGLADEFVPVVLPQAATRGHEIGRVAIDNRVRWYALRHDHLHHIANDQVG
jgi:hypothetical protein